MTARHRPPPRLTIGRVAIAARAHRRVVVDGLLTVAILLPIAALIAAAVDVAPHATHPVTVAAPTAVELTREPSGHGGPINPPTFPTDAWQPEDGPLIIDGQALPAPEAVVTSAAPDVNSPPENSRQETSSPAPVAKAEPAAEPEPQTELLRLVNADRAAAGCEPVTIADDLTSQAQNHSNGQAAADSMFHSESGSRLAENVAFGYPDEAAVHQGWMNSPDHRDNILDCSFGAIGFGMAVSASGVPYWTEQFA